MVTSTEASELLDKSCGLTMKQVENEFPDFADHGDLLDFDDLFGVAGDMLPDLEILSGDHMNDSSSSDKTHHSQGETNKGVSFKGEEVVSKRDNAAAETLTFDRKMKYSSSSKNKEAKRKVKGFFTVMMLLIVESQFCGGEAMSSSPRRILADDSVNCNLIPNVTVAKDGSGTYQTIGEAVSSVPDQSFSRFVIYVKEGIYYENVSKYNLVMYGDGITKTIVSSNLSVIDNKSSTWKTATFSVDAKRFVGKDMKFVNTAGQEKGQAVAFHSNSDQSVMYRCAFDAYQDTLYAHAGKHLYRDCDIVGTIDFICGKAAAVFQNCTIRPRVLPNQVSFVTAQSADEPNMLSGFSIIESKIYPFDREGVIYLGRPWRMYSTVVVMKTLIEKFIDPKGWVAWTKNESAPTTITYGEYMNYGPGSSVDNRVNWTGYMPKMTDKEAHKYTVDALINEGGWLKETCVPYNGSF